MLTLSLQDRDRLFVLRQVREGTLSVAQAARRLRLGNRHMRRLVRRFEREGAAAVVHGLRGQPSNRCLAPEVRERALAKAREEEHEDFGPTLLAEHLAREGVHVHPSTLRLWLIEAGSWKVQPRKLRHRKCRERRPAFGELVLMDSSIHPWLEDRSSEEIVLIAMIDDATSRLFARFVARDTGAANRQLILDYMRRFGRMGALYTDRASHFGNWRRPHGSVKAAEAREAEMTSSIIRRAQETLGSELIIALSPQAKGRVERLFGTLQDRLVKEMRVAAVSSLEAANQFLEEHFIPFWNERFTVEAVATNDAHRPVPADVDLERLFAETEERTIANDFTIRFKNQYFQIEAEEAAACMPKQRLVVERRLDGSLRFCFRGRYLTPTPIPERSRPQRSSAGSSTAPPTEIGPHSSILSPDSRSSAPPQAPAPRTAPERPRRPAPRKPAPDHPWRRYPLRARPSPPPSVEASASLRPDSPAPRVALCSP